MLNYDELIYCMPVMQAKKQRNKQRNTFKIILSLIVSFLALLINYLSKGFMAHLEVIGAEYNI